MRTTAWREQAEAAVASGNREQVLGVARGGPVRLLRYLNGRLYSNDRQEQQRVLRALGTVVADRRLVSHQRVADLLRRYLWALNDESGAVPYGVPEAIAAVLAARPEFQEEYVPLLCSLLTEEEMSQTGPIERSALRAVGRLGPAVATSGPVVDAVRRAARSHPEAETRKVAAKALAALSNADRS